MSRRIAVIGGGASGIFAALGAKREGALVTVFERNPIIGKKLLLTGNGRCNFSNLTLTGDHNAAFYSRGDTLAQKILGKFCIIDTLKVFEDAGIIVYDREGYLYPASNHASSVRDALELLILREGVEIRTDIKVTGISECEDFEKGAIAYPRTGFELTMCGEDGVMQTEVFDACIIACGGRAYPDTGSDGFGYKLCRKLGIPQVKPYPALTKCMYENDPLSLASGVRCDCRITLMIDGAAELSDTGQLQILKDAISGIVTFQLSGRAIRAFEEGRDVSFVLDLFSDVSKGEYPAADIISGRLDIGVRSGEAGRSSDECDLTCRNLDLEEYLIHKIHEYDGLKIKDLFTGIFVRPLSDAIFKKAGIESHEAPASSLGDKEIKHLVHTVRNWEIKMSGHGSFAQCQVCSGGVDLSAVDEDLMVKDIPGLYVTGELLDVDGICGGYNLQFAMSSGMVAGRAAACHAE